jgi:hypothetical protein
MLYCSPDRWGAPRIRINFNTIIPVQSRARMDGNSYCCVVRFDNIPFHQFINPLASNLCIKQFVSYLAVKGFNIVVLPGTTGLYIQIPQGVC